MKRTHLASVAKETLAILKTGHYTSPAGRVVALGKHLRLAKDGTCSYPREARVKVPAFPDRATRIEVVNATTLEAARGLADKGNRVAALNFASAKDPGGGFLTGAQDVELLPAPRACTPCCSTIRCITTTGPAKIRCTPPG